MDGVAPTTFLAQLDQDALWARAERLRRASDRACTLAHGLPGAARAMLAEIDSAHAAVEAAEQAMEAARLPGRIAAARRDLARAYAAEQAVMARAGFRSWTAFALRRVDLAVDPDATAALAAAEWELSRARAAWQVVSEGIDVDVALAARADVEALLAPSPAPSPAPAPAPAQVPARASMGISSGAAARWPGRTLAVG